MQKINSQFIKATNSDKLKKEILKQNPRFKKCLKRKASEENGKEDNDNKVECDECNKLCKNQRGLKMHKRFKHS